MVSSLSVRPRACSFLQRHYDLIRTPRLCGGGWLYRGQPNETPIARNSDMFRPYLHHVRELRYVFRRGDGIDAGSRYSKSIQRRLRVVQEERGELFKTEIGNLVIFRKASIMQLTACRRDRRRPYNLRSDIKHETDTSLHCARARGTLSGRNSCWKDGRVV